jgi:hypothetical protein
MTGRWFSLTCGECKMTLDRDSQEVLFADAERLGWVLRGNHKTACFDCYLKGTVGADEYELAMNAYLRGSAK